MHIFISVERTTVAENLDVVIRTNNNIRHILCVVCKYTVKQLHDGSHGSGSRGAYTYLK